MTTTPTLEQQLQPSDSRWLLPTVPRADLLPPSLRAADALRRVKRMALLFVVAALAAVVLLWLLAVTGRNAAQSDLDAEQATQARLQSEVAKYAEVPRTKAALATSQQTLAAAMADDVRWSLLLADLAAMPNGGVALTQVTGKYGEEPVAPGAAAAAAAPSAPGTIQFTGTAPTMPAVSAWLENLAKRTWDRNPYLNNATLDTQTSGLVTWQATADLTDVLLSNKYQTKAGS